jgi:hypothetical protein
LYSFPNRLLHLFWYWAKQFPAITYSAHSFIQPLQYERIACIQPGKQNHRQPFPDLILIPKNISSMSSACRLTPEGKIERKIRCLINWSWCGREGKGHRYVLFLYCSVDLG